jgi:hypothetical protein
LFSGEGFRVGTEAFERRLRRLVEVHESFENRKSQAP